MDNKFHIIDMQNWKRSQIFHYFSNMAPTVYSITVEVNITKFKKSLEKENIKFFPAYLWIVTKTLNQQIEFKIALKDDVLGYWDTLTPLYANFHEDDKTISLMWTEYNEDFKQFYESYIENKKLFQNNHGILSQMPELPPSSSYTISCIPWLNFNHFSIQSNNNKPYYFPTIEAGKFVEKNGQLMLPISITAHHATTDGWHINKFIDDLQLYMNNWNY